MILLGGLTSCSDSLGVNGANYTKSQLNDEIIRRDTMIDFKKVIIETIITKTDTIINYIPVNKVYDLAYANRYNLQLFEQFENRQGNSVGEQLHNDAEFEIVSFLNYNPITPIISCKIKVENGKNIEKQDFIDRTEIIESLSLEFKGLPVLNDSPISFRELIQNYDFEVELKLVNMDGDTREIKDDFIFGELQIHNRLIQNGQLRALSISGIMQIAPKDQMSMKKYLIEFTAILFFPEI